MTFKGEGDTGNTKQTRRGGLSLSAAVTAGDDEAPAAPPPAEGQSTLTLRKIHVSVQRSESRRRSEG